MSHLKNHSALIIALVLLACSAQAAERPNILFVFSDDHAAQAVIDEIGSLGGDGGLIALDRHGRHADPFNSQGMKRAWLSPDGAVGVDVFGP